MEIAITLLVAGTGVLLAVIGWFARAWAARVEQQISDTNAIVRRELRPNGGQSMWDRMTHVEGDLDSIKQELQRGQGRPR